MVARKLTVRIFLTLAVLLIFWFAYEVYVQEQKIEENELSMKASELPVVVTVFYEALCPDSRNFIVRQLAPAYEKLPHLIDIEYVPYGKATTNTNKDGSLGFECQHGPIECEANIVHACVAEIVRDSATKLNVIACMIRDNMIPKDAFARCAKDYSLEDVQKVKDCYSNPHGAELLKVHGERTHALRPKVSFIPTITLDGDQRRQANVLKDLRSEVCAVLSGKGPPPDACKR